PRADATVRGRVFAVSAWIVGGGAFEPCCPCGWGGDGRVGSEGDRGVLRGAEGVRCGQRAGGWRCPNTQEDGLGASRERHPKGG
ncbi:unnamed protein product, partial [Ectocarpus sp. 12 AP-2014]